MTGSNNYLFQ